MLLFKISWKSPHLTGTARVQTCILDHLDIIFDGLFIWVWQLKMKLCKSFIGITKNNCFLSQQIMEDVVAIQRHRRNCGNVWENCQHSTESVSLGQFKLDVYTKESPGHVGQIRHKCALLWLWQGKLWRFYHQSFFFLPLPCFLHPNNN